MIMHTALELQHWPLFYQISIISIITLFLQLYLFPYRGSLAHVFQYDAARVTDGDIIGQDAHLWT